MPSQTIDLRRQRISMIRYTHALTVSLKSEVSVCRVNFDYF